MPKPDLQYHIANCPDKAMLEHILSYGMFHYYSNCNALRRARVAQ
jgi:hypothetical protein